MLPLIVTVTCTTASPDHTKFDVEQRSLIAESLVLVCDSVQLLRIRVVHLLVQHLAQRPVHRPAPVLAFGFPFELRFHGRASLMRQKYIALAAAR